LATGGDGPALTTPEPAARIWGQGDSAMPPEPGKDRYFITTRGQDDPNWQPGPDDWALFAEMMRDRLVARLFAAIDPALAEDTLRPVSEADEGEAEDELQNFLMIGAGVEPPMKEKGQNFALRARVLEGILAANQADISRELQNKPMSAEMLRKRMEHFKFMGQQEQNKQIGRIGVVPALQGEQG
jgi:hypothetical protein